MPTRQRTFPELAIQRTPVLCRSDIGAASSADVSSQLVPIAAQMAYISGQVYSVDMEAAAISGSLILTNANVAALNSGLSGLTSSVVSISGDVKDLDLSLTVSIDTLFNTTSSSATSGSVTIPDTAQGFITINVGGIPFKIPYFNI